MATEFHSAIDRHRERYRVFSGRQLVNALCESVKVQLHSKVGSDGWCDAIAREQALKAEIESRM
jgi:hypothetical protein